MTAKKSSNEESRERALNERLTINIYQVIDSNARRLSTLIRSIQRESDYGFPDGVNVSEDDNVEGLYAISFRRGGGSVLRDSIARVVSNNQIWTYNLGIEERISSNGWEYDVVTEFFKRKDIISPDLEPYDFESAKGNRRVMQVRFV